METATAVQDFEVEDNDDICLEDDLSPEEIEETRAEMERYAERERAAAAKVVAQSNRDRVEHFRASGMDIVDYTSIHADSPESADFIAAMAGFRSTTWNDHRNVHRRESEKRRAPSILSKSAAKAAVQYIEERQADKPATAQPKSAQAQPVELDAAQRVTGYYNQLIKEHPARADKLRRSLAWQLAQLDQYAGRVELWETRATMAAQAKVRN